MAEITYGRIPKPGEKISQLSREIAGVPNRPVPVHIDDGQITAGGWYKEIVVTSFLIEPSKGTKKDTVAVSFVTPKNTIDSFGGVYSWFREHLNEKGVAANLEETTKHNKSMWTLNVRSGQANITLDLPRVPEVLENGITVCNVSNLKPARK